jgi:tetratricopeptide (TPR) repeat protein/DNA-binding CsgD family transcriptional regulator
MHEIETRLLAAQDPKKRLTIIAEFVGEYLFTNFEQAVIYLEEGYKLVAPIRRRGEGKLEYAKLLQGSGIRYELLRDFKAAERDLTSALKLFIQLSEKRREAWTTLLLGALPALRGEYDKAELLFERARQQYEAIDDYQGVARSLNRLAAVQMRTGRSTDALNRFTEAKRYAAQAGEPITEAEALLGIGITQTHLGNFDPALSALLKSLAVAEAMEYYRGEANALNAIGNVYALLNDHRHAIEYYQRSLNLDEQLGAAGAIGGTCVNIGTMYLRLGELDDASRWLEKGTALGEQSNDQNIYSTGLEALAATDLQRGRLAEAREAIERALAVKHKIKDKAGIVGSLQTMGDIQMQQGDCAAGIASVEQSIAIAKTIGSKLLIRDGNAQLSKFYRMSGDPEKALEYFEKYHAINEELLRMEGDRRVQHIKLERDRQLAEARSTQLELEKAQMSRELNLKTKHLAALAMTIEQYSSFLSSIGEELRAVAKTAPARNKKLMDELTHKLKRQSSASDAWQIFEQQLDTLNNDFIAVLARKFPKLTPQELKICALLKVGLGSKEIANVLSLTTRSVETYRLSMRRKLKLPKSGNLATFIVGFRE